MILLHFDQKRAGERHSLKDLPEIQRIHEGSKGGGGYVKYVRYILNYLFSIEKKIGLVISTLNRIISGHRIGIWTQCVEEAICGILQQLTLATRARKRC